LNETREISTLGRRKKRERERDATKREKEERLHGTSISS